MKFVSVLALFLAACFYARAAGTEKFYFSNLTANNGLSNNTIKAIAQDGDGLIWIGTREGLDRYDGAHLLQVMRIEGGITALKADRHGNIWAGTTQSLHLFSPDAVQLRSIPVQEVTAIERLDDRTAAIGTGKGLLLFEEGKQEPDTAALLNVRCLCRAEDMLYIGTDRQGLYVMSCNSRSIRKFESFGENSTIQEIYHTKAGSLIVGTEGDGIYIFDGSSLSEHYTSENSELLSNYIRALGSDSFGRLWIGSVKGLNILSDKRFISLTHSPFEDGCLSDNSVRCIYCDRQDGMWLGTYHRGVNYWHPRRNHFDKITVDKAPDSLSGEIVSCIREDGNYIYIGTNGTGLDRYDKRTGRIKVLSDMTADIKALSIDRDCIYVGSHAAGLARIDKADDMLMSIDLDNVPESIRTMVGNLLGYRAMSYFELARMFEFQPTGYAELDEKAESDGIIGLTVPIIEARAYTLAELIKNPRAPFYKMYRFIWNDLCLAEELLAGYRRPTMSSMEKVSLMNEYVIHGLKARFWLELATRFNRSAEDLAAQIAAEGSADGCRDLGITSAADCYKNAIAEADKVINEGGFTPTTMEQWYDIETGFFKPTQAWVWGSCITSTEENPGRWYSHIGWISTEADWGWTNSDFKCYRCIGSSLYDKISWDDWRKATWIDPYYAGYGDEVKENYEIQQTAEYAASYPAYSNLKFRVPHLTDYKSGLTCCTPFMRVEEMILLRAEALYYTEGADAAKSALESFVNTYRYLDEPEDGAYTCDASTESNFISALMLQRRIEFWGEGIVFYDYKRLRLPVQRSLSSNFPDTYTLDTKNGYVAPWMNCYLSAYAVSLKDSNFKGNPNFSGIVKPQ